MGPGKMHFSRLIIFYVFVEIQGCLSEKTYFSRWIKIDQQYPKEIFNSETIVGKGLHQCIKSCKAKLACKYINFRVNAGMCSLISVANNTDETDMYVDRIEKKKGYIFGRKQDWNMETYDRCKECKLYGSCGEEIPTAVCQNPGCGPPNVKPLTNVYGNMFSVGNRVEYRCADGYAEVTGNTGIALCEGSGVWSSINISCLPDVAARNCFENSCYMLLTNPLNWYDGKEYCHSIGAFMADMKTQSVYDFLRQGIFSVYKVYTWLGAKDNAGLSVYTWLDGTLVRDGYQVWAPGEPSSASERCLAYVPFRGNTWEQQWHDAGCERNFYILCEFQIK